MSAVATAILAGCVLEAAKIHEESFNQEGCDSASAMGLVVDPEEFHEIDLHEASEIACKSYPGLAEAVYLILKMSWNDGLAWAIAVIDGHEGQAKVVSGTQ